MSGGADAICGVPEDGPAPLQDLRPQAGRGLEQRVISTNSCGDSQSPTTSYTNRRTRIRMRRFLVVKISSHSM